MVKRITKLTVFMVFLFALLYMRLFIIINNDEYTSAGKGQGSMSIKIDSADGNIYDRDFELLVNDTVKYTAIINPTSEAVREILPYVENQEEFYNSLVYGKPFSCEVSRSEFESEDITVFEIPERNSENQLAKHVIGYAQNGSGMTGIESSYNDFLRSASKENSVTYSVDGRGHALEGLGKEVKSAGKMVSGVVLTIDRKIQQITEKAAKKMKKGAVIVMDSESGDILAMVSVPDYDFDDLESALQDESSPLINRCLYSYNVGSIFKLITAQAAFESGINEDYSYECTGSNEVSSQLFKCHDLNGHGKQDMYEAMTNSCNTYFIDVGQRIDSKIFIETALKMGFGRSTILASTIVSSTGNIPTEAELSLPAEKANFSFGQGKLLASPLQVGAMTCAIANDGKLPVPRLVRGITQDGKSISDENKHRYTRVLDRTEAFRLQELMIKAVNDNEDSNARPENTFAAGKTSTAQTGRYDKNKTEICHGWITGYFPVSRPKYAVTVLCEDGGFGNDCAAPVFREITENITEKICEKD